MMIIYIYDLFRIGLEKKMLDVEYASFQGHYFKSNLLNQTNKELQDDLSVNH